MAKALIITITPSLRITVGNGASTVEEETVVKSGDNAGKSKWSPVGHHGTLDDALRSILAKHMDRLTTKQMWDVRQARDAIRDGVQLLRQVSVGRLFSEKRAAEAQLLEMGENVKRLEAALAEKDEQLSEIAKLDAKVRELEEKAAEERKRLDREAAEKLLKLEARAEKAERQVERLKTEANAVALGRSTPDVVD